LQLDGYVGCYSDAENNFVDLRPLEGKPSFNQLKLKSDRELKELLKIGLTE